MFRTISVCILSLVALSACGPAVKLQNEANLSGRKIAFISNSPARFSREFSQSYSQPILVRMVIDGVNMATSSADLAAVSEPSVSPGRVARDRLSSYLTARFGLRLASDIPAPTDTTTGRGARSEALVALARQRGFDGIVVDVQPGRFSMIDSGSWFAAEALIRYVADMTMIDAETGKVLASGQCSVASDGLVAMQDLTGGGQAAIDAEATALGQRCSDQLISKVFN